MNRELRTYTLTVVVEPQGSRMSLVGDDLEHIGVVPGGLLAPRTYGSERPTDWLPVVARPTEGVAE